MPQGDTYHNVTPAHYFTMINKQISYDLSKGREQMKRLAGVAQVNMADSNFNALELKDSGTVPCRHSR